MRAKRDPARRVGATSRQLLHHLKTCTLDVEVHIGQNLHVGECGAPLLGELHGLEDTAVADGRTAAGYVGCEVDRF